MSKAEITIIMPVYNAEKYLKNAIESVLSQTYDKFVFLIINDGSRDDSEKIILSYSDERIKYIKNEKNLGIVKTLNKGLELVKTRYLARMDADDVCDKRRLELQIKEMEENPEIALLGTWAELINEDGNVIGELTPFVEDKQIKTALLFSNIFVHSSVMIRQSVLKENGWQYNINHKAVEDYGLWLKISFKYNVKILPQKLLKYRLNTNGIMAIENKNIDNIIKNRAEISKIIFNYCHIDMKEKQEWSDYVAFVNGFKRKINMDRMIEVFDEIRRKNKKEIDICLYNKLFSGAYRGYAKNNDISIYSFYKALMKNDTSKKEEKFNEVCKYIVTRIKNIIGRMKE